jgi:hypothetical protein
MNSYTIATVSIIAAACLIAATIAVPIVSNSAYAVGNRNSIGSTSQAANGNGLIGLNAAVGVQAGSICVNALSAAGC